MINDNSHINSASSMLSTKINDFNEREISLEGEVIGNAFYVDWATYDNGTAKVFGATLFDEGAGKFVFYQDPEDFEKKVELMQGYNSKLVTIVRTVQKTNGKEKDAQLHFNVQHPKDSQNLLAERLSEGTAKCLAELSLAVYETEDIGFSIAMYPENASYGDEFYILMRSDKTINTVDIHRFTVGEQILSYIKGKKRQCIARVSLCFMP